MMGPLCLSGAGLIRCAFSKAVQRTPTSLYPSPGRLVGKRLERLNLGGNRCLPLPYTPGPPRRGSKPTYDQCGILGAKGDFSELLVWSIGLPRHEYWWMHASCSRHTKDHACTLLLVRAGSLYTYTSLLYRLFRACWFPAPALDVCRFPAFLCIEPLLANPMVLCGRWVGGGAT